MIRVTRGEGREPREGGGREEVDEVGEQSTREWGESGGAHQICNPLAHKAGQKTVHDPYKLLGHRPTDRTRRWAHKPFCKGPQLLRVEVGALVALSQEVVQAVPAELPVLEDEALACGPWGFSAPLQGASRVADPGGQGR